MKQVFYLFVIVMTMIVESVSQDTIREKSSNIDNASNEATTTRILTKLTLETNTTSLNVGDKAKLTVVGRYNNNITKQIDSNIELHLTPKGSVDINGTTLVAKRDGNVTVQTKRDNIVSNTVTLNIKWVVDEHTLPPEPDPTLNNSTLLGIDSNDNGVRDDVERYIYERFSKDPEYPKTKTALAMQDAWATQKILETPTIESKKYLDDAIDCQYYWFSIKQEKEHNKIIELSKSNFSESIELSIKSSKWRRINKVFNDIELKDMKLNTKERILRKFKFNEACSGHIFRGRKESIENCQTNIDTLGE